MNQSALDPHGPVARTILDLGWVLFGVTVVVYVLVLAGLAWALLRQRREGDATAATERRFTTVITTLTILTALTLVGLVSVSEVSGRALAVPGTPRPVSVDVIGHQWWWEFQYRDRDPSKLFTSPNELHIPVGVPVVLQARSPDVIHSFWVPNLTGKRDLIPGQVTTTWMQADTAGIYRGQCAEFCGPSHAKMAFLVVAEPVEKFQAWIQHQREPASDPAAGQATQGRDLFLSRQCALCHAIHGTPAGAHTGPDLTHVGSRLTIAAGALPNEQPPLDAWVENAPSIKPGVRMPPHMLEAAEREAVVAYLRSLQ
jgi:cytochrome c oxidase subunit 2